MTEPRLLEHDPQLAHEVYDAMRRSNGWNPWSYSRWLRNYVDPIAAVLGYVVLDHYRTARLGKRRAAAGTRRRGRKWVEAKVGRGGT